MVEAPTLHQGGGGVKDEPCPLRSEPEGRGGYPTTDEPVAVRVRGSLEDDRDATDTTGSDPGAGSSGELRPLDSDSGTCTTIVRTPQVEPRNGSARIRCRLLVVPGGRARHTLSPRQVRKKKARGGNLCDDGPVRTRCVAWRAGIPGRRGSRPGGERTVNNRSPVAWPVVPPVSVLPLPI